MLWSREFLYAAGNRTRAILTVTNTVELPGLLRRSDACPKVDNQWRGNIIGALRYNPDGHE
jgi:hypothetical protein